MSTRFRIVLAVVCLAAAAFASWRTSLVDGTTRATGTAIRIAGEVTHVAYYSSVGLRYARHDSAGWTTETLDGWNGPHNRGPSIALDSTGSPVIAYYRGTPWLAFWTGSDWQHEQIDPDSSGDYIWAAFAPDGRLAVAYNKGGGLSGSRLKYAWRDSTGWHPALIDAANSGFDCVLTFEPSGRPVIADCQSWSSGALYWRVLTDTGWTRATLLAAGASQSCLAMGPGGVPHISYYATGGGDYDLRLVWRDGDEWRYGIVDPGRQQTKRGWDNSIVVDRLGAAHISYHAHNERELRYAWGRPGNWTVEVVDRVGMWNLASSLVLDDRDRAWIAYCDEDENDALYVAVRDEPTGVAAPQFRAKFTPATLVRGVLRLPASLITPRSSLITADGRKAMELQPGDNDASRLVPGVYFVRGRQTTASRVVVTR